MNRTDFTSFTRVVVKLGTGILTDEENRPDKRRMRRLVRQLLALTDAGRDVVVVSSGAVGAGMGALGLTKRPKDLARLQACAAVGQSQLMAAYDRLFSKADRSVAQVLLTHEDLRHKQRHVNARNTLLALLEQNVTPIINENDVVSFTELKFGDNDRLSALTACLLPADLLVILTTADGLVEGFGGPNAKVVDEVTRIDADVEAMARGTTTVTATGGMITKIDAARVATQSGIPVVIANGTASDSLTRIMEGQNVGTYFKPSAAKLKGRKRWIAFFHRPKGSLWVDPGAAAAIARNGKSLLRPGVSKWVGRFRAGDVVSVRDENGHEIARGLCRFGSTQLKNSSASRSTAVHRDDLVIL